MNRVVNSAQMKAFDKNTIEYHGIPSLVLMERAALSVAEELEQGKYPFGSFDLAHVLIVCGGGNNGGDGIAIARILHLAGKKVSVCQLGDPKRMSEDCKSQEFIAKSYGVPFVNNPNYSEYTTIVDAVFGVGLSRTIEGKYKDAILNMNQSSAKVMAVDIPSGINADNGHILGCAVQADATVTFAYAKAGHLLYPGKQNTGILRVKDIGIYADPGFFVQENIKISNCKVSHENEYQGFCYDMLEQYSMEKEDLSLIPKRNASGNKGTFGKVLIVAGSKGMAGAAVLCAHAAMRCGSGMAKVITHDSNRAVLQQAVPEVMTGTYEEVEDAIRELKKGLEWADVVVCGCGLGRDSLAEEIVSFIIHECTLPLVLDADALNIISEHMEWLDAVSTECIITPHLGEMSRLTKQNIDDIRNEMIKTAISFAKRYRLTCVLKDAATCTASSDGRVYFNTSGNSGMASAGSGDVLAGMIGGLLAVGTSEVYAGALGAYLHGLCGDKAKSCYGESYMMAGNIIESLAYYLK